MELSLRSREPLFAADDELAILIPQFKRLAELVQKKSQEAGERSLTSREMEGAYERPGSDPRRIDELLRYKRETEEIEIAPYSRLGQLLARFHLDALERDVLLLSLLPQFASSYAQLFANLQPGSWKSQPTAGMASELLCGDWNTQKKLQLALMPDSRLLGTGLLTLRQKEGETLGEAVLAADHMLYWWLLGSATLPLAISLYAAWLPVPETEDLTPVFTRQLAHCCYESERSSVVAVLRSHHADEAAAVVGRAARLRGRSVLQLDLTNLGTGQRTETVQQIVLLALREVLLNEACLVLRSPECLFERCPELTHWLASRLRLFEAPVFFLADTATTLPYLTGLGQVVLDMPEISSGGVTALLERELADVPTEPGLDFASLVKRFKPDAQAVPQLIREAIIYGRLRAGDNALLSFADLQRAFQIHAQQPFGKLAQRVTPIRTFDDLVIRDEIQQQLGEILAAVRQREKVLERGFGRKIAYGTGISALFYGDPGTGKTMAAEILAGELGVDLIKVDLSTIVDKYIGETEKNLARVFDYAQRDSGVLFFDEAEALFGKRTEVKDSKDRHANIEVAYLLQRLESYPGLVIMATNHRDHLDPAFSRRLTFIARFPFPDATLRERMWKTIWPAHVIPDSDINFGLLAQRAEITGANIRNVALLASWLASDEGDDRVRYSHIERAVERELKKIGRAVG